MSKEVWLICSAPKKSKHCKENCFCGVPHLKESGHDSCHLNWEKCSLSKSGINLSVICRPIKKRKI